MNVKTEEELSAAVAAGDVLVDFWAPWCGPCMMMSRIIEEQIAPAMPQLKVVKVNIDEAPELAAKFGVMSIPALFCYKNGVKGASFVGVTDAAEIRRSFV